MDNVQNEAKTTVNIDKKIDNDPIKQNDPETLTNDQEVEDSINKVHEMGSNNSSCKSEPEKCDLEPQTVPESTSRKKKKKKRKKKKTNHDKQAKIDSPLGPLTSSNLTYDPKAKKLIIQKPKKKRTIREFQEQRDWENILTEGFHEFTGGIPQKDIDLVSKQANCRPCEALYALKDNDGDIVNAIMELTDPKTYDICNDVQSFDCDVCNNLHED